MYIIPPWTSYEIYLRMSPPKEGAWETLQVTIGKFLKIWQVEADKAIIQ